MNLFKYRKIILQDFKIVKVSVQEMFRERIQCSGGILWINSGEVCVGYQLHGNIFRPVFPHERQKLIDQMLNELLVTDFWKKQQNKYKTELLKIEKLPIECVETIVTFIC